MDNAPTSRPQGPPEPPEADGADGSGTYAICVQGRLDARWSSGLAGMALRTTPDGFTVLEGLVVDQTALYGVLQRLRDLGLPLQSVTRVPSPARPSQPRRSTSCTTPHPRHLIDRSLT